MAAISPSDPYGNEGVAFTGAAGRPRRGRDVLSDENASRRHYELDQAYSREPVNTTTPFNEHVAAGQRIKRDSRRRGSSHLCSSEGRPGEIGPTPALATEGASVMPAVARVLVTIRTPTPVVPSAGRELSQRIRYDKQRHAPYASWKT